MMECSRLARHRLLTVLIVGLTVTAVACVQDSSESTAQGQSAYTADVCLANADDPDPIEVDDGADAEPPPAVIISSQLTPLANDPATGCSSITISDPRKPPKHPPLPVPLPKDWNTRCPAYGPPAAPAIDPAKCTKTSPTVMTCKLTVGGKVVPFTCRRDTPGGKGDAKGAKCNFHCYVD
jgi:hypothetical protein